MHVRMILVAALAVIGLAACGGGKQAGAGGDTMKPAENATLYDRLGGKDAITAVVGEFIVIVAADERINLFFKNIDAENLKKQLVDQICQASGGPCKYTGKDMKTAHAGMGVKAEHFDALVEDLGKALDKFKVGQREKDELVAALAPLKEQIVTQ